MPGLAKWVNSDLSKGFTVPQVAQKHGWPEPLVWSQALVNKDDFSRFKALNWGLQETHIFQAPLSSERFQANVVSAMQKKKIVGVTSRYVIITKKLQVGWVEKRNPTNAYDSLCSIFSLTKMIPCHSD